MMGWITAFSKPFTDSAFNRYAYLLRSLFAGFLIPFGFAPFHVPGCAILGVALLFLQLPGLSWKASFKVGFVFGIGFLGLGVSWVFVSVHEYGHLNAVWAFFITGLFIGYLAVFLGLMTVLFHFLSIRLGKLWACIVFSALWCLGEYCRATIFTGFPWLLLGFGQIDTPLKYVFPIIGVYGVGFLVCLSATVLAVSMQMASNKRYIWIAGFVLIVLMPMTLQDKRWTVIHEEPLSVGVIQANLSMRDKWDEALFWELLGYYQLAMDALIGKKQLIVMPESAIPLPPSYLSDFLATVDAKAKQANTSILLGIPQPTSDEQLYFYNALMALGKAKGYYHKQHLVPFGEFIPTVFQRLADWLGIPVANLKPGITNQRLIRVQRHPIATLICYELAYPELLRRQLPEAQWLVSISDDGWFGHSFAMYQHLQMAQVLSMQTGRYQIVANNDGLSSIINDRGSIVASLPAFASGQLQDNIYPATGSTPWVAWGDKPILGLSMLIVLGALLHQARKRSDVGERKRA